MRPSGVTETESFLGNLCQESFLDLWSYQNVYRDQGRNNQRGDGKELCDLIVVCNDDIILFSDKNISFHSNKTDIAWQRWYQKAIYNSAKQVLGAERWIRTFPEKIFQDKQCTQPLHIPLPDLETARFHRVLVASGAKDACKQYFENARRGSFLIFGHAPNSDYSGILPSGTFPPFTIGDINPTGEFFHVFNEENIAIVLSELNTITDFIQYLTRKEKFIRSGHLVCAASEEDLLGYYLRYADKKGLHYFAPPEGASWTPQQFATIGEGLWDSYIKHAQYLQRKSADKISYLWDDLISQFTKHIIAGTSMRLSSPNAGPHEGGVRYMAMEPRTTRRLHAIMLDDAIRTAPPDRPTMRALIPNRRESYTKTGYIFLQCPFDVTQHKNYDAYREYRSGYLYAYTLVAASKFRHLHRIIGIATEPPYWQGKKQKSEDMILIDSQHLTPQMERQAKRLRKQFRIFSQKSLQRGKMSVKEYPDGDNEGVAISPFPASTEPHLNRQQRRARAKGNRTKK